MAKSVEYEVVLKNGQFTSAARESEQAIKDVGSAVSGISSLAKSAAGAMAGLFSISAAIEFSKNIIKVRSDIESLEISFSTLLGSVDKAASLMGDLRDFASSTPLQLGDLAQGAQTLLAFGTDASEIMPILRAIGDISMGDAQKLNSLTLAFAQMSSTGKLMGQDLMQMINQGFNPLQVISEKTGKSIGVLKEEMGKGAISAAMVKDAFLSAASEGGQFFGMLEKQSRGLSGSISNLQGAISDMMNELGENTEGFVTRSVHGLTDLVENYKKVGKAIADIAIVYGSYKAAVIATTVVEKIAYQAHLAEMAGLSKKEALLTVLKEKQELLNRTMLKNPYAIAAAAVAALCVWMYKLATAQSEAEKLQKKVNDEMGKAKGSVQTATTEYDRLISKLTAAKKGSEEYANAIEDINSKYGDYLTKLHSEAEDLRTNTELQKSLRQEIINTANARARSVLQEQAGSALDEVFSSSMGTIEKKLQKLYKDDQDGLDNAKGIISKMMQEGRIFELNGSSYAERKLSEDITKRSGWIKTENNAIFSALEEYAEARKAYVKAMQDADSLFGTTTTDSNSNPNPKPEPDPDPDKAEKARKKSIENEQNKLAGLYAASRLKKLELAELEKQQADEDAIAKLQEEILSIEGKIGTSETKLKGLYNADENNKAEASIRTAKDNAKKLSKEMRRANEQSQIEIDQASIDAMKDGVDKEVAQIELNYRKLQAEYEKQADNLLEQQVKIQEELYKQQHPEDANLTGFVRENVTLTDEQKSALAKYRQEVIDAYPVNAIRALMDESIRNQRTYEEKRLAIESDYRAKMKLLQDDDGNLKQGATQDDVSRLARMYNESLQQLKSDTVGTVDDYVTTIINRMTGLNTKRYLTAKLKELVKFAQDNVGNIASATGENASRFGISTEALANLLQSDDALKALVNDLDAIENSDAISGLTKAIQKLKKAKAQAKNGDLVSEEDVAKAEDAVMDAVGRVKGAIVSELSNIGEALRDMGEYLDNDSLKEAGDVLGQVIENVQAAEAGAQAWGGWWGAIIGGVVDLIPRITQWFTQEGKLNKELAATNKEIEMLDTQMQLLKVGGVNEDNIRDLEALYDDYISGLEKQIAEYEEKNKNGKYDAEIAALKLQIEQLMQERDDMWADMFSDSYGLSSTDIFNDLSDAIWDAFANGETSLDSFDDKFNEMMLNVIKKKVLFDYLGNQIEDFVNDLGEDMQNGGFDSGEDSLAAIEEYRERWKQMVADGMGGLEYLNELFGSLGAFGDSASSLSGSIQGITSEQAGMLAGQMNAMRTAQAAQTALLTDQLEALNDIEHNTRYVRDIYNFLRQNNVGANSNLNRAYGQN